jgi:hypothetical protein
MKASIPSSTNEQSFERGTLCRGVGIDDESNQVP